MINFTSGAANVLGACRAAQVDTILTAHAFIEKARLEKLIAQIEKHVRIVYLEDIRKTVSFADKLRGALRAHKPLVARKPDDWGVVLFTSGTEGTPKGVVLSHRNVLANVAQVEARIDFGREDRLFMALPAFHSFGFMGGIVLPLISGVPTYLYPSPLHYRTVPELVYGICATICSAPIRSSPATRAWPTPTTFARCATSYRAASRSRNRPAASIWKSSACASLKVTA